MKVSQSRIWSARLFCLFFASIFLAKCAPRSADVDPSNQQGFGLNGEASPDDFYCPDGYAYDSLYRVCQGHSGVLGPFSEDMVQKCLSFGGGAPCRGLNWQPEFTHGIRGTGRCPIGTQWDAELGVCLSVDNVYGPFMKSQHARCVAAGGGPACETMRWSRSFFESFRTGKTGSSASSASGEFSFREPRDSEIADAFSLWATYYRIPTVEDQGSSGIPLLDMDGNDLGVSLSKKDWCHAALEGSVRVIDGNGDGTVFNYAGSRESYRQADCSGYVEIPGLSYSRFYRAKGHYGDGVSGYFLQPYRTIAVDPSYVPYGSVIYIPAARGSRIVLPNGKQAVHDGYFFAADTGGAIHNDHIDVFIGSAIDCPFQFIKSNNSGKFKVYLIDSLEVKEKLKMAHTVR